MLMETKPSFFKVLVNDFSSRLRIPPAFIKYLDTELPKKLPQEFIVETYSGRRVWYVDVEKADNILYLGKGWKEFAQDNSLQMGEFLVFRYDGNFKFKLEIYGRNCCKKLGIGAAAGAGGKAAAAALRSNQQMPLLCLDSVKKRKRSSEASTSAVVEENHQNFNSKYPFFKATMRTSYLHHSYLNVPKSFVRANRLRQKKIKLEVSNNTWTVKLFNRGHHARLRSNWTKFVRDNGLQEEDVCLFELVNTNDVMLRVTILRKQEQRQREMLLILP